MAKITTKDDDLGSLFFQPDDISSLFDGGDWQPMDIEGITEDPWLSMTTPPDSTGLGGMTDIFNVGNGGIAGMDPSQYAALFGNMANTVRPPGATSGYAAPGGLTAAQLLQALKPPPWLQALGAIGALGTGLLDRNATQDATNQVVQGLNNASTQATNLIGGAQANYQPYMQAGTTALSKLAAMGNSNLAGQFKPLGTGKYIG